MPPDGGRVHAIHPTAIAVARCLRELGQGWVPRPSCRTLLAAYAGVRSVPRHGFRVTRPCRVADRGADGGPGCRPRTDADRCRRRRPRTRSRPSVGRAWEDAHRAVADDGQREARCHAVKRNRHRVVRGADARLLEVVLQKAPVEAGRLGTGGPLLQVVLQLAAARGVAKLAQRLGLDLADPLTGHVELLAHLLQSPGTPVLKAEAELKHASLAPRE